MRSLQDQQRVWLASKLKNAQRGTRAALARHLGIRQDAISRIIGNKEAREITLDELAGMAEFFDDPPPGLSPGHKGPAPLPRVHKVTQVPLLDSVAAGKLRAPSSQIPVEDVPLLAFADLGRGEWFALTVDGNSMDRVAPHNATIVINRQDRELVGGKYYVFSDRGETGFKMFRNNPARWLPHSTEAGHPERFLKSKDEAERMVVGRVKRAILDL